MSEKTLKFNNINLNKKEFHKSKQPVDFDLVTIDQIVVSDKFKGYLHYKTIFCNKVALNVQLMSFFI